MSLLKSAKEHLLPVTPLTLHCTENQEADDIWEGIQDGTEYRLTAPP